MFPKYADVSASLLAELNRRGGEAKPSDEDADGRNVYEALADNFDLDTDARTLRIYEKNGTARSKWENIVRWARENLRQQGKLDGSQRGLWKLTDSGKEEVAEAENEEITQRGFVPTRKIGLEEFKERLSRMEEIGAAGETFVLGREKKRLTSQGLPKLAERVQQISLENVAAGYDILSFTETGDELYLEVKSSGTTKSNFELTSNEYEVAKQKGAAYVICRVTKLREAQPEVQEFRDPAKLISEGRMKLKPTSFRVSVLDSD